MSVLNIDLNNVQEPQPVPDGQYEVEVVGTPEIRTSQRSNQEYINLRLQVVGEPTAADIYDIVMLPHQTEDDTTNERRKLRLKRLCEAFGVEFAVGSIELEEFEGRRAGALVTTENDEEYGDRNRIRRYLPI